MSILDSVTRTLGDTLSLYDRYRQGELDRDRLSFEQSLLSQRYVLNVPGVETQDGGAPAGGAVAAAQALAGKVDLKHVIIAGGIALAVLVAVRV